jgi:hypothetical protein
MAVTHTPNHSIPLLDPEAVASYQDINDALERVDEILIPPSQAGLIKERARFGAVLDAEDWTVDGDRWYIDVINAAVTVNTDLEVYVDATQAGKVPLLDVCTPLAGKARLYANRQPGSDIMVTVSVREVLA